MWSERPQRSAAILGLGVHRPATYLDNATIAARIDSSDEWIRERSGIVTRGVAAEDESVVDMATDSAEKALATAGIAAADVGLVLLATCSMPGLLPGGAPEVAFRLGAHSAGAADLTAACAGFTYGLALAANTVRCGDADNVLVIGAEKLFPMVDPHDREVAFLFGDAAGAAVVGLAEIDGIGPVVWAHDGGQNEAITLDHSPRVKMQGRQVYRWATTTLPKLVRSACERAGIAVEELAAFIPHQANLRITEAVARSLNLPPSVVIARDIVESGNTSAASVPLAFARLLDRAEISTGDPVLVIGFGSGMTVAGQVVRCP
jgi:3-oxoacyl-[acyl-carrier-protein] synthase-3